MRAWLSILAAAVASSFGTVPAGSVSPAAAPVEWVRYAEAATASIGAWLGAEDEVPTRFRTYLDQTRADGAAPVVELKLWIAANGSVERIEFAPFVQEQANNDLRMTIVGRRLPPPPRRMRQPLRLAVALDDAPVQSSIALSTR